MNQTKCLVQDDTIGTVRAVIGPRGNVAERLSYSGWTLLSQAAFYWRIVEF